MKKIFGALGAAFIVLLAGCGSISTSKLAKPAVDSQISLPNGLSYVRENSGLTNKNLWNVSLAPGTYRAEFEDANGTFYRGDGAVLVERRRRYDYGAATPSKTFIHTHHGGIYLPKDESQPPKIYMVAGTMTQQILDGDDSAVPLEGGNVTAVVTGVTAGQAAVGGVAATGLMALAAAAERGNLAFYIDRMQPDAAAVRAAIVR